MYEDKFREFSALVARADKALLKAKAEYVKPFGLRGVHVSCLLALLNAAGGLTASELSERCGVDRAQISRVVSEPGLRHGGRRTAALPRQPLPDGRGQEDGGGHARHRR